MKKNEDSGWFCHLLSHTNPGTMEIRSCYRRGEKEGMALEGMCGGKYWNMDNFSGDFSSFTKN